MNRWTLALVASSTLTLTLPAAAQFQKPEDAIKYRQAAMTLIASHFGRVGAMAQGKIPFDAKAAAANIEIANTVAPLALAGFGPGTDKGRPNRAKPEIWSQPDKFKVSYDDMLSTMGKLNVAAKTGDLEQIKSAVGAVGKTCKGCHDDYQSKDYSAN